MNKIVSFDFDGTLTRPDVQEYCKSLLKLGYDVHVVTTRFDELHKHLWQNKPTNDDMYLITDKVGIKRENIHFMNFNYGKGAYLFDSFAKFHLDDDDHELDGFVAKQKTKPVFVLRSDWKVICDNILK